MLARLRGVARERAVRMPADAAARPPTPDERGPNERAPNERAPDERAPDAAPDAAGTGPGPGPSPGKAPPDLDLAAMVDGLERTVLYRLVVRADGRRSMPYVSGSVTRLFGLSPAELRTDVRRWYDLIEPLDAERVAAEEAAAIAEGRPLSVEARFNVPDGQRMFSITASPSAPGPDGAVAWDGVISDVTRLWRAREERERLTEIVEATADAVGTTDIDGRLTYINEAGRRMLGMDHRDPAMRRRVLTFADALPERLHARYGEHIIPAVLRDGVWAGETTILDARGRERVVSQVIVAHRGPDGRATHLSTILRDLSEREALERELRRLNLHAATLLDEVNHRVKNLFALLPAIVQLSARGRTDVNEVVAVVRERVTALARSHALTLDSPETSGGIALDALVRAVLEPYEDRADAFAVEGPTVRLTMQDGSGLGLMLHELATNAAKHGALALPGGRVSITWSLASDRDGDRGTDRVAGTGSGANRLRLEWRERGMSGLQPPSQASGQSSGFGTRLVDRLLEAQGGTVERAWHETGLAISVEIPFYEARPTGDADTGGADTGDADAARDTL